MERGKLVLFLEKTNQAGLAQKRMKEIYELKGYPNGASAGFCC